MSKVETIFEVVTSKTTGEESTVPTFVRNFKCGFKVTTTYYEKWKEAMTVVYYQDVRVSRLHIMKDIDEKQAKSFLEHLQDMDIAVILATGNVKRKKEGIRTGNKKRSVNAYLDNTIGHKAFGK